MRSLIALTALLVTLPSAAFELKSPDVQPGRPLAEAQVFEGFGCHGGNLSPALAWDKVPAGTRSFALTVYDPDAPTGSGWWHWVVYNLPATTHALPRGIGKGAQLPAGALSGRTDFGGTGFGGACPPVGDKPHRYIFTVHALKVEKLDVPADASPALIGFAINANRIAKASLTATYGRN
ncbi:YbhB/YbcL family Raf kinase inhibitor-like protein [Niveibacterium terrae]|uniref:YbhB/YbcL family Raf kinase inhibitor-like protein n=1 Tax=Niveibacterium terrae TaxID=3373598 RepID=UPI003A8CFFFA